MTPPQVRAPMAYCLHQPNQLALICRQLEVANGLLKKVRGSAPWCRTVPNPTLEASQSTMNSLSKSGIWRTGPVVRARLSAWKASAAS
jgi:hypothetical protein